MKWYLHLALILAFVTAGISPACAFVSGKTSFIELCAPDGSIKKVQVPADMDPFAKPPMQDDTQHMQTGLDDCAFCFAHAHGKFIKAQSSSINSPLSGNYIKVSAGTTIPLSLDLSAFQPRAPPLFV